MKYQFGDLFVSSLLSVFVFLLTPTSLWNIDHPQGESDSITSLLSKVVAQKNPHKHPHKKTRKKPHKNPHKNPIKTPHKKTLEEIEVTPPPLQEIKAVATVHLQRLGLRSTDQLSFTQSPLGMWVAWPKVFTTKTHWSIFTITMEGGAWMVSPITQLPLPPECVDEDCVGWRVYTKFPQLCSTPMLGLMFRALMPEGEGSEAHLFLLLNVSPNTNISKQPKQPNKDKSGQLDQPWRLVWQRVIASEVLSNTHTESLYTHTKLSNTPSSTPKRNDSFFCQTLITTTQQSARSFNRVDARESEFDERDLEIEHFEYKNGLFTLIDTNDESEIKVRDH